MADHTHNVVMVDFTNGKTGNKFMSGANAAMYAINELIKHCDAWDDTLIAGYLGKRFVAVTGMEEMTPEMIGFFACLSSFCGCVARGNTGNSYPIEERE